ncbi:MAG TPA: substrate-binding domain-containing protein, partial [Spirochaetia bacterium]|nr:substrate-binding domain-containing protein [Spirochaetia bacterium]
SSWTGRWRATTTPCSSARTTSAWGGRPEGSPPGSWGPGAGTSWSSRAARAPPPAVERSEGFREEIGKRSDARLLPPLVADWLRDRAEDELTARSGSLPGIDVVFAQNDAMAYGAWRAFQAAGRTGIKLIGIDGLPGPMGGIDLVRKGILAATFTCPTGGKEAVAYAVDLLSKKEGIPKKI